MLGIPQSAAVALTHTPVSVAVQVQVAHAIFSCDPGTVTDVRNHFGDQLPQTYGVAALPENNFYNTSIINRFSNDTAWRYLGCLPEITVLTIWIEQNTTLPDEWGAAGSFLNLEMLVLASDYLLGSLPEAWGAPFSFPQLDNMTIIDSRQLEGPLPESWGQNGSFAGLRSLVMYNNLGNARLLYRKQFLYNGWSIEILLSLQLVPCLRLSAHIVLCCQLK